MDHDGTRGQSTARHRSAWARHSIVRQWARHGSALQRHGTASVGSGLSRTAAASQWLGSDGLATARHRTGGARNGEALGCGALVRQGTGRRRTASGRTGEEAQREVAQRRGAGGECSGERRQGAARVRTTGQWQSVGRRWRAWHWQRGAMQRRWDGRGWEAAARDCVVLECAGMALDGSG